MEQAHKKKRLRRELSLILGVAIVMVAALITLYVADQDNNLVENWSSDVYSAIAGE